MLISNIDIYNHLIFVILTKYNYMDHNLELKIYNFKAWYLSKFCFDLTFVH